MSGNRAATSSWSFCRTGFIVEQVSRSERRESNGKLMRIGIVITRASALGPSWTTTHLIHALLAAGHSVRVVEGGDFELDPRGRLMARATALDKPLDKSTICEHIARRKGARVFVEVPQLNALVIRINPLDAAVLAFAQLAAHAGVCVLNDPFHLPAVSHKSFLLALHGVPKPETLLTRSLSAIRHFLASSDHGVVIKPARASGGRGVALVTPESPITVESAVEQVRQHGNGYVVAQAYLPEAREGEKRLLWVGGQLLGGYRRMRAPGEFRHNLKHGAKPEACELTESDFAIERAIRPHLLRTGVWFAGLDVIGGKVIEVNVLNPGGSHFAEATGGRALGPDIVRSLEKEIAFHLAPTEDKESSNSELEGTKPSPFEKTESPCHKTNH